MILVVTNLHIHTHTHWQTRHTHWQTHTLTDTQRNKTLPLFLWPVLVIYKWWSWSCRSTWPDNYTHTQTYTLTDTDRDTQTEQTLPLFVRAVLVVYNGGHDLVVVLGQTTIHTHRQTYTLTDTDRDTQTDTDRDTQRHKPLPLFLRAVLVVYDGHDLVVVLGQTTIHTHRQTYTLTDRHYPCFSGRSLSSMMVVMILS